MDRKPRSFKESWLEYKQKKKPQVATKFRSSSSSSFLKVLHHIFDDHQYEVRCNNLKDLAKAIKLSEELTTSIERYIPSFYQCTKNDSYFFKYNLKSLEKISLVRSCLILLFNCIYQISQTINFNTIRNFTIQKNLSISA